MNLLVAGYVIFKSERQCNPLSNAANLGSNSPNGVCAGDAGPSGVDRGHFRYAEHVKEFSKGSNRELGAIHLGLCLGTVLPTCHYGGLRTDNKRKALDLPLIS